jgi:hypothetical protein
VGGNGKRATVASRSQVVSPKVVANRTVHASKRESEIKAITVQQVKEASSDQAIPVDDDFQEF